MDWNSDGEWDIVSGDRNGYLNVFIRHGDSLTAYKQYQDIQGAVMDVGYNSEPNVFDWNGDGMKDLIIGEQSNRVRLYLNRASDTWPLFDNSQYSAVQAGGSQISFYRVNPYLFDLDRDGMLDLICGEQNGYIHYFRNIGMPGSPVFAAGETLKLQNGTPVRWNRTGYYYGSRCGFGDWNNDSVPDFLLSTYEGQIELYLGIEQVGVEEAPHASRIVPYAGPTIVRDVVVLSPADSGEQAAVLLDACGRPVLELVPGANDIRHLATGVYFCRLTSGANSRTVRVVLTD